jgi:hypothetical protein
MAAVVAVKTADVAPVATAMVPGTVRAGLPLERATVAPPLGAAPERVTVQLLEEFAPMLVGLQTTVEAVTLTATELRLKVAFAELPL